ncbi:MAG TPA: hypothetical protein PLB35_02515 [Myxococcota bacterium]|nr:hypothetical protein [Myxococcota bacterium]HOH76103.1 hypothetical protein [Myxococcota bacterium]
MEQIINVYYSLLWLQARAYLRGLHDFIAPFFKIWHEVPEKEWFGFNKLAEYFNQMIRLAYQLKRFKRLKCPFAPSTSIVVSPFIVMLPVVRYSVNQFSHGSTTGMLRPTIQELTFGQTLVSQGRGQIGLACDEAPANKMVRLIVQAETVRIRTGCVKDFVQSYINQMQTVFQEIEVRVKYPAI